MKTQTPFTVPQILAMRQWFHKKEIGCVYIVRVIDILVRFWYTHCYEHEKYR